MQIWITNKTLNWLRKNPKWRKFLYFYYFIFPSLPSLEEFLFFEITFISIFPQSENNFLPSFGIVFIFYFPQNYFLKFSLRLFWFYFLDHFALVFVVFHWTGWSLYSNAFVQPNHESLALNTMKFQISSGARVAASQSHNFECPQALVRLLENKILYPLFLRLIIY